MAYFSRVPSGYAGEHFAFALGGDYRGDRGDTSPQHFGWGGRKGKCPPLIAHFTPKCLLR